MPIFDAMSGSKKEQVMKDTWGHLYPRPGQKYCGEMIVAVGQYGDQIIVDSDFPGLESSPQRYHLEHTIFERVQLTEGVHKVSCCLWFYKNTQEGGKIINIQTEKVA